MKKLIYFMIMFITMVFINACGDIEPTQPTDPMQLGVEKVKNILICEYKYIKEFDRKEFLEMWEMGNSTLKINGKLQSPGWKPDRLYTGLGIGYLGGNFIVYEEDGAILFDIYCRKDNWGNDTIHSFKILSISKDELVLLLLPPKQEREFYKSEDINQYLHLYAHIDLRDYGIKYVYYHQFEDYTRAYWYMKDGKAVPLIYGYTENYTVTYNKNKTEYWNLYYNIKHKK